MKNQALPNVILHIKNLESTEFINKKHGKLFLHSLLANHMLELSVKLKFQLIRFEKKHCFAVVVLNWIKAYSHDVSCIIRFFCTIMLKLITEFKLNRKLVQNSVN